MEKGESDRILRYSYKKLRVVSRYQRSTCRSAFGIKKLNLQTLILIYNNDIKRNSLSIKKYL